MTREIPRIQYLEHFGERIQKFVEAQLERIMKIRENSKENYYTRKANRRSLENSGSIEINEEYCRENGRKIHNKSVEAIQIPLIC